MRILIVGNRGGSNVGESLARASAELGVEVEQIEPFEAMRAPKWVRRLAWHALDRRPPRMHSFGAMIDARCREFRPDLLLCMGFAPLSYRRLQGIGCQGIRRAAYLTDDPWNRAHRSRWFMRALPEYDCVFTAREANLGDLRSAGAQHVEYLPFGYDPLLCPELHLDSQNSEYDLAFVGGADADRVPYITALRNAGLSVGLYGSYWEKFPATRDLTKGQLRIDAVPAAIGRARMSLCIVRRANRDCQSMRTYEVPAMGACMLTEFTVAHERLFGPEGNSVLYFRTLDEMVQKAMYLVRNPQERMRLAKAARTIVRTGRHTYKDRLETLLRIAMPHELSPVSVNAAREQVS